MILPSSFNKLKPIQENNINIRALKCVKKLLLWAFHLEMKINNTTFATEQITITQSGEYMLEIYTGEDAYGAKFELE